MSFNVDSHHLIIDGYRCTAKDKLADMEFVYAFLDEMPSKIGMTKIMPPYVFKYTDKGSEVPGISGVVLIAESHISIHTFPETGEFHADVYSCKKYNRSLAVRHLGKGYLPGRLEYNTVRLHSGITQNIPVVIEYDDNLLKYNVFRLRQDLTKQRSAAPEYSMVVNL